MIQVLTTLAVTTAPAASPITTAICPVDTGGIIGTITGSLVGIMSAAGALGAGAAVFLENLFPPIPSEVILPLAGFVAAQGRMTLAEAIFGATIGSVAGALALYGVACWIGAERLRRLFDWMPLTCADDIDKADRWFARYGSTAVLIGRVIPIVRSLVSIPAGVARLRLGRFIILTALGSTVWNTILVLTGYLLGSNWCSVLGFLDRFQIIVAFVLAGLLVWWLIARIRDLASR